MMRLFKIPSVTGNKYKPPSKNNALNKNVSTLTIKKTLEK